MTELLGFALLDVWGVLLSVSRIDKMDFLGGKSENVEKSDL